MNQPPPTILKKIQTLAQITADLRKGKDFSITRLTVLKSLCADPEAAAKFALHIAKLTQKKMASRSRPGPAKPTKNGLYKKIVAGAVRGMTEYVKRRSTKTEEALYELLSQAKDAQNEYDRQHWGPVRIIHSMDLLVVETALECVLRPLDSSAFGYLLARRYAERYNSRFGTGLLPESAPMMEEIVAFWGRYYLGSGWKKKLQVSGRIRGTHTLLLT